LKPSCNAQGHTSERHGELIYPGTCRTGLQGRVGRAWRLRTDFYASNKPLAHINTAQAAIQKIANNDSNICWTDRRLGLQQQNVPAEVGDFVLKRADGCFAYQLAVVVDDAAQGITDVVRGEDLADNTARQILLQRALGLPTPRYLHTPLGAGCQWRKTLQTKWRITHRYHRATACAQQRRCCAGAAWANGELDRCACYVDCDVVAPLPHRAIAVVTGD
jgi:glutamyl-Q tRNA(Asp) synthetase